MWKMGNDYLMRGEIMIKMTYYLAFYFNSNNYCAISHLVQDKTSIIIIMHIKLNKRFVVEFNCEMPKRVNLQLPSIYMLARCFVAL